LPVPRIDLPSIVVVGRGESPSSLPPPPPLPPSPFASSPEASFSRGGFPSVVGLSPRSFPSLPLRAVGDSRWVAAVCCAPLTGLTLTLKFACASPFPLAGDAAGDFPSAVVIDAEVEERPSVVESLGRRDNEGIETPPARSLRVKGVI
jgi:hypothetical protein